MALPGIPIPETQCIGDSLWSINNALTALDFNLDALGSQVLINKNDLWLLKSADYTASKADKIAADTNTSTWTLTLPVPENGAWIQVADVNKCWDQPNKHLTIGRSGGATIENLAEDFVCDSKYSLLTFVYTSATWRVYI